MAAQSVSRQRHDTPCESRILRAHFFRVTGMQPRMRTRDDVHDRLKCHVWLCGRVCHYRCRRRRHRRRHRYNLLTGESLVVRIARTRAWARGDS